MTSKLVTLPEILHIQLNIFDWFSHPEPTKLDTLIQCPQQIDLKNYLIYNHKNSETIYQLYGILIHSGTIDEGHYFAKLNIGIGSHSKNGFVSKIHLLIIFQH
jgi:ubiquitin carboxyl-terminal hydrolase 7